MAKRSEIAQYQRVSAEPVKSGVPVTIRPSYGYFSLLSTNFNHEDWISQVEAARLRGVTRQAINKLIQAGRLETLTIGGKVLVSRASLALFEPKKAGRPAKVRHSVEAKK
ncbi:MAG TPA: hypothetical protein VEB20_24095 [Azospirillaceae bacterium]|nr:hypothetical protein [Azospirillaceae bacterium]